MSKPTIFFSHSSADKESLIKLKELFVEKTGSTIDVFLSSDGQSIPFGRNWVQKIQDALAEAKIMFVFLTPNSIESKWIYFESGFSYSKGIKVVPVGLLGVDLNAIKPPLSLLQGFNIKSEEGFNNIISIVNEEFNFTHSLSFINLDYNSIVSESGSTLSSIFGENLQYVRQFKLEIIPNEYALNSNEILDTIRLVLEEEKFDYQKNDYTLLLHGININDYGSYIGIQIDPLFLEQRSNLIEKILSKIRKNGMENLDLYISFEEGVKNLHVNEKFSSKIYNTDIKFFKNGKFNYYNLTFNFLSSPLLTIELSDNFHIKEIAELIAILFKKEILYATNDFYTRFY